MFNYKLPLFQSIVASVVRWCVRVRPSSKSRGRLSSGFVFGWLVAPSSPTARSRYAVRYILDLPQSSPSLPTERSTASPTPEYSTMVFQVHRGGQQSYVLPLVPTSGAHPQSVPVGLVCLYVSSLSPTLP